MLNKFLFAILLFLMPVSSWAITFDTATGTTVNSANAANNFSYSHTIASDANFIVVASGVRDGGSNPQPITSVTVGGVAMTQVASCSPSQTILNLTLWYLARPPTGAQTVAGSVTGTGINDQIAVASASYKGVVGTIGNCITATSGGT